MTMRLRMAWAAMLLLLSTMAIGQVEDSDAARLAARFAHLAGSAENAMALMLALHTGTTARLVAEGEGTGLPEVVAIAPPTGPMSWTEVRTTMLNVQDVLVRAAILRPSLNELHVALLGGELPRRGEVRGVLQMRAEGFSWMDIARATSPQASARRISGAR